MVKLNTLFVRLRDPQNLNVCGKGLGQCNWHDPRKVWRLGSKGKIGGNSYAVKSGVEASSEFRGGSK